MRRLERLVAIHETLRRASPHRVSAARLAEEYGVTRRTIERDLDALRLAGVPLYGERGRNGGQVSLDDVGSTVVTLSPSEVTALLVAVQAAGPDMPFADAAAAAVDRLLDGLPTATRVAVEELRSRVRTQAPPMGRVGRRVRRTVDTAVQSGRVVNLVYLDADGTETTRSVDALGLYQGAQGWFLIGWCHLRADGRIFRLDRIQRASLTTRAVGDHDIDETLGWTPDVVAPP